MGGKIGITSDPSATYSFNPNMTHTVCGVGSKARALGKEDPSYENVNEAPREEEKGTMVTFWPKWLMFHA